MCTHCQKDETTKVINTDKKGRWEGRRERERERERERGSRHREKRKMKMEN